MFEREGANVSSTVTISFTQVMYMYLVIFVFSNLLKLCGHGEISNLHMWRLVSLYKDNRNKSISLVIKCTHSAYFIDRSVLYLMCQYTDRVKIRSKHILTSPVMYYCSDPRQHGILFV